MKDVILSICLSIYLFVRLFVLLYPYWNWAPSHPTLPQHSLLSLPYTASIPIEIGPKRLRAKTTQGRNDSPT